MKNIHSYVLYGLMAIAALVVGIGIFGGSYDLMLKYTYVLSIGTAVLALAALVLGMVANTSTLKSMLFIIVGLAAVYAISYGMSTDALTADYIEDGVSTGVSKSSGTGLIVVYILMILSVASMVFSAVLKMVRR